MRYGMCVLAACGLRVSAHRPLPLSPVNSPPHPRFRVLTHLALALLRLTFYHVWARGACAPPHGRSPSPSAGRRLVRLRRLSSPGSCGIEVEAVARRALLAVAMAMQDDAAPRNTTSGGSRMLRAVNHFYPSGEAGIAQYTRHLALGVGQAAYPRRALPANPLPVA